MNQQSTVSLKASGGALLLNLTKAAFQPRRLLQRQEEEEAEEEAYFVDYSPPARDSITLPRNVVYVLVGVVLVTVATYAIVGHLIKDLIHDLADCIFGPKPVEEDLEEEREEVEGDVRLSGGGGVRSALTQKDKLRMEKEKEKEGLLPGFHHDDSGFRPPPFPPPLRSSISSSYPREKRTSTHSVTFVCPVAPFVTSL